MALKAGSIAAASRDRSRRSVSEPQQTVLYVQWIRDDKAISRKFPKFPDPFGISGNSSEPAGQRPGAAPDLRPKGFVTPTGSRPGIDAHRSSWERGRLARIARRRSCRPICGRDARVWKTRRSQDAVPAQAAPWGEIRRQPPRTEPEPRKNAVSVGVRISRPPLYILYLKRLRTAPGARTPRHVRGGVFAGHASRERSWARRPGNARVPPASIGGGLAIPFAGGTPASGRRAVPRTPCPGAFASGAPGENPHRAHASPGAPLVRGAAARV